jgi:peptidoglycan/xylan/chitin deacetylase (PgdA/CDA1 family)
MQVHLTYDVEIWADSWNEMDASLPEAFRRLTYGPLPRERGALPLNLQILRDNGLRAVFFVEPLFSYYYGLNALQELVGVIMEAGQDVQMHIHPEWLDVLPNEIVPRRKNTQMLHSFSLGEQEVLLEAAASRLVEAGAPRPTAFRSGNYSANIDTLRALARIGVKVDSSFNACFDFPYPDKGGTRLLYPSTMENIAEYPVTLFRDGIGRVRPMQITACSIAEMTQGLSRARDQGLPAATLVSHNFELLSADRRSEDRIVTRRFAGLCEWLGRNAAEFPTASFDPSVVPAVTPAWELPRVSLLATGQRYVAQVARRLVH